jgi:glycosyltransferase involved in cell wall biosynthesis
VNPRVSVIIPARNASATILETLDSVIAQTCESWEAIVADDDSSDGTAELVRGYHPRVKCIGSPHNLGIGGARNLALTCATGELVALLDADDVWLPEYLARQLASYDVAVARGERVGIVCCDTFEVDAHGTREQTFFERTGWRGPTTLTSLLRHNTIFISAIVPRTLVEELGGFATNCLGTEDYDMWLRILETGRTVLVTPEPLALYRRGDASVSANEAQMARATQTVYRQALRRGRLDSRQRAIARRELRLQRLIEISREAERRRAETGRRSWGSFARAAPLSARVILERPGRWLHWLRLSTGALRG